MTALLLGSRVRWHRPSHRYSFSPARHTWPMCRVVNLFFSYLKRLRSGRKKTAPAREWTKKDSLLSFEMLITHFGLILSRTKVFRPYKTRSAYLLNSFKNFKNSYIIIEHEFLYFDMYVTVMRSEFKKGSHRLKSPWQRFLILCDHDRCHETVSG